MNIIASSRREHGRRTVLTNAVCVFLDSLLGYALLEGYDEGCRSTGFISIVCLVYSEWEGGGYMGGLTWWWIEIWVGEAIGLGCGL